MVIRNRLLAFIYRLLASIIGILGLVFVFQVDKIDQLNANPLRYFGTLTTLYTVCVLLIETIISLLGLRKKAKKGVPQTFGQILFVSIALEMSLLMGHPLYYLFIHCFNVSQAYFAYDRLWAQLFMYVLIPLVSFFDWLLFSEKGNWKWHWVIYFITIPLFYTVFSFLNHYIRTSTTFATLIFDPNTFLNYPLLGELDGWAGVLISSSLMFALYVGVAFFMIFLSFFAGGKYAKKRKLISNEIGESI